MKIYQVVIVIVLAVASIVMVKLSLGKEGAYIVADSFLAIDGIPGYCEKLSDELGANLVLVYYPAICSSCEFFDALLYLSETIPDNYKCVVLLGPGYSAEEADVLSYNYDLPYVRLLPPGFKNQLSMFFKKYNSGTIGTVLVKSGSSLEAVTLLHSKSDADYILESIRQPSI